MKKVFAFLLACVMLFGCAACSRPNAGTNPSAAVTPASGGDPLAQTYNFATATTGTSWYVYGATITDLLTKAGMKINMQAYGGGLADLLQMQSGESNISESFSACSNWSYNGTVAYEETGANPNLRLVSGSLDKMYVVLVLNPALGVTSLEEIVEQQLPVHVYTAPPGDTSDYVTQMLFESLGADYETIQSWGGTITHTDQATIASDYSSGMVDVFARMCSVGHPTMTEIATTNDVIVTELSQTTIDYMEQFSFGEMSIPENSFGEHKEVRTVGMVTTLVADAGVSDEVTYLMAKTMYENKDTLVMGHAGFEDFDLDTCYLSEENGGIPLHPGAEQYYREQGLID